MNNKQNKSRRTRIEEIATIGRRLSESQLVKVSGGLYVPTEVASFAGPDTVDTSRD